jgi:uncharacterized protein GlcG (DUF336 family)
MLPLDGAYAIANAAFAEADRREISPVSIVVIESTGVVRLAWRSDAQGSFGVTSARAKAESALGFGLSTRRMQVIFGGNPSATAGLNGATRGRFIPVAGGVVISTAAGTVIGAAAISSGDPGADDEMVREAVRISGFQSLE